MMKVIWFSSLICLVIQCSGDTGPIICAGPIHSNKSADIPHLLGYSEKICQIDRLIHVSSWLRNHSQFQGYVGQRGGRSQVSYYPAENSYSRWSGLLSPCDADWLGMLVVKKAKGSDMIVPGPSYKGKVFFERPTFDGYVGWGCGSGKSRTESGELCSSDSGTSSGLLPSDRVLWIGDVACQPMTPIPEETFLELKSFSQSEFPDICKIDGIVFNQCESESLPQPFDVAWMDVGHSHKIIMREHKTKWVQESSSKDFVCYKQGTGPCSESEEKTCKTSGSCRGDMQFCKVAGCEHGEEASEAKCRCSLVHKPGEVVVSYGGMRVRPKCYGFSRMMATLEVNPPEQRIGQCTGCHLECVNGGVRLITLTSELKSATVCASHFCSSATSGKKSTEIQFHSGSLVGKTAIHVKGALLDGTEFTFEGSCMFPDGCDAVDCTFCREFLKNPQCYPAKKWLFIIIVILLGYAGLMLLTNVLKAIAVWGSWVIAPVKLMFAIIKKLMRSVSCLMGKLMDRGRQVIHEEIGENREGNQDDVRIEMARPRRVRHWMYSPVILTVLAVGLAEGCDEMVHADSKLVSCKQGSGNMKECVTTGRALLPAVNPGQEACLHFTAPGSPDSKCLKIKVKKINLKCKKSSSYFVPDARSRCTSVRRCRWAGDCQSGCPSHFTSNSFSDDWAGKMDRAGLGFSGCSDGCGGAACGCFNAAPSCIFWRKWVENPHGIIWKVSPCAAWVPSAVIELTMPSGEVRTFHPMSGIPTQVFKGVSVTYLGSDMEVSGLTDLCEIEELKSKKLALAPCNQAGMGVVGKVGEIQCSSEESARTIKKDGCIWNADLVGIELRVDDAVCYSKITSVEAVANYSAIPTTIGGLRFERSHDSQGKISGSPLDITAIRGSFSVNYRGLRLSLSEITATCTGEVTNVSGCYSCMTGAKVSIKLHSNKNSTAHVRCKGDETAFSVLEGVHSYTVSLSFDHAVVDEQCQLNCGGHESQVTLKGNLIFLDVPKFVDGSYMQTYHSSVPTGANIPSPTDWLNALFGNGLSRWILGVIGVLLGGLALFFLIMSLFKLGTKQVFRSRTKLA
ncbi:membrane glycoprotein polyprotein [Severe fever with thrombocytopenia syndrome virus]|uniref:Envelopment polyprotein n=1 Tax=Dabie bandavirus TaxID=1003835 RepID=A0A0D6A9V4_SFTS|nr:membrane glycoprotein polyprotein [Severe fever with thrombocytopenia syndrome virus]